MTMKLSQKFAIYQYVKTRIEPNDISWDDYLLDFIENVNSGKVLIAEPYLSLSPVVIRQEISRLANNFGKYLKTITEN